jgi:hypothetical protein
MEKLEMSESTSEVAILERIASLLKEWKNEPSWLDKPLPVLRGAHESGAPVYTPPDPSRLRGVVEAASEVARLLELGDQRLLAGDGPASGQNAATALSADESAELYQACRKIVDEIVTHVKTSTVALPDHALFDELKAKAHSQVAGFGIIDDPGDKDTSCLTAGEVARLRADAARYRWLVDVNVDSVIGIAYRCKEATKYDAFDVDKAVDVAMAADEGEPSVDAKTPTGPAFTGKSGSKIDPGDPVAFDASSDRVVVMPTKSDGKTETTDIFRHRRKCVVTSEVDDLPEAALETAAKIEEVDEIPTDSLETFWFSALKSARSEGHIERQERALRELKTLGYAIVSLSDGTADKPLTTDQADNSEEPGATARDERLSELGG